MSAVKFTFDTVFDGGAEIPSAAARARKRHTLNEAELEDLRAEAHAAGLRAGEVRAQEQLAAGARARSASSDPTFTFSVRPRTSSSATYTRSSGCCTRSSRVVSEMKSGNGVPFVIPSRREAVLTVSPIVVYSMRRSEPMLPVMIEPLFRPIPIRNPSP